MNDLETQIENLKLRSSTAACRLKQINQGIETDDDDTYEQSTSLEESTMDDLEEEELELIQFEHPLNDDDCSDYYPSDHEALALNERTRNKYTNRAIQAVKTWTVLPRDPLVNGNIWIAQIYKSSKRLVPKGPSLIYFVNDTPLRLCANYLFGTKSIAFNICLYEFMHPRYVSVSNRTITFTSLGRGAVNHAEIHSEVVPLNEYIPQADSNVRVLKCTSNVTAIPEPHAQIWSLEFLDEDRTCISRRMPQFLLCFIRPCSIPNTLPS
jgi:hypothetical protein